MSELSWYFRKKQKDEISIDPMDAEFFVDDNDSSKLVREAIQNSLDAKLSKAESITFRLQLVRDKKIPANNEYIIDLKEHLRETSPNSGLIEKPMDYLVIEDFNTKGLQGDPKQYEDVENDTKNDFFYFWRNRGRSEKAVEARGRWGLGKLVFPHCSKINTFFGYTVRGNDRKHLLMGLSDLKIHQYQGARYDSTAFYCKYESGLQMPTDNLQDISNFKRTFNLKRTDEPGFSVVIAYPNETIDIASLIRSCIEHYYFPLLTGEIEIEISDGIEDYLLNSENITKIVKKVLEEPQELITKFDFVKWIIEKGESEIVKLKSANSTGKSPQWHPDLIPLEEIDELKEKFVENKRLGIRVPLKLTKRNGEKHSTHFDVFIEKDPELANMSDVSFIREGLTISKMTADRIRAKGVRAQILIREKVISEFLGDSENPAHTEWQQNQPKIKEKYEMSHSTVLFVKNSINRLIEYLSPTIGGRDDTLLKDFFWFEKDEIVEKGKKKRGQKGKKKGDSSSAPKIDIDSKSVLNYRIIPYDDGFQILHKTNRDTPEEILLEMGYDLASGDTFTNYSEFDFRIDEFPIAVSSNNADVEYGPKDGLKGNQMIIRPKGPKFEVKVIGFDMKSNLTIDDSGRNFNVRDK